MPRSKLGEEYYPMSFRLSGTGKQLLEDTAKHLGVNLTATLEIAIRKLARAEGIPERPAEAEDKEDTNA